MKTDDKAELKLLFNKTAKPFFNTDTKEPMSSETLKSRSFVPKSSIKIPGGLIFSSTCDGGGGA